MFTMCNAALNACWNTVTARRYWTEQRQHEQAGPHPLPNRTEFINFFERNFINDDSSFCSRMLLEIDLQCHVFPVEKPLLSVRKCRPPTCKRHFWWRQIWRHLHVTVLKFWAKFSIILMRWVMSIRMIHAKSYKTLFKFVKVMPRKLVASFFRTRCISLYSVAYLTFIRLSQWYEGAVTK